MIEKRIARRTFPKGAVSSAGLALAGCSDSEPPTYGNILRMGDNLTYKAHRDGYYQKPRKLI